MDDLISRSALLEKECCGRISGNDVRNAPAVNAEPVRRGKWIDRGDYITTAYGSLDLKVCSYCNAEVTLDDYDDYCPNCGAKMDLEVQDE